jgi:prevent-host-death family protein
MTIHVNIGEAKTRLSELIAAALRGEEVVIGKAGRPVARLVPEKDAVDLERAGRLAERNAWIGSGKGRYSEQALDEVVEPAFTEEEWNALLSKQDQL